MIILQIRLPNAEIPPAKPESRRRAVPRRDLERTGDGHLKVVGNVADEIVFLSVLGRWL